MHPHPRPYHFKTSETRTGANNRLVFLRNRARTNIARALKKWNERGFVLTLHGIEEESGIYYAYAQGVINQMMQEGIVSECDRVEGFRTYRMKGIREGVHGKAGKDKMIERSKELGCKPRDDDEADAFLILKWAIEQYAPRTEITVKAEE